MFHNVRIPRENLLNKTGDVTPDGRYATPFKVSKISNDDQRMHQFRTFITPKLNSVVLKGIVIQRDRCEIPVANKR